MLGSAAQLTTAPAAAARLLKDVYARPWAHDFFALMRRLDALHPQAPRTGQAQRPGQEPLRLAQSPDMNFAPAPLQRLELRDGAAPRLSVRFLGLLGPQGPMPTHFTEYVRDRVHHHGDTASAHFLDLFHHRFLGLFYSAWAQAQPVVHADRPHDDRYLMWLASATGLPLGGLQRQGAPVGATLAPVAMNPAAQQPATAQGLPLQALAFHAGLLATRSHHAEALCKVLQHNLDVRARVQSHMGQWLGIERQDRSRLGFAASRPERHDAPAAQLQHDANAGSRVWDRQHRFRLQLGPLAWAQYQRLLPAGPRSQGASDWAALLQWMQLLASPHLNWDIELQLHPPHRPPARLARGALRLGVSTWLPGQPPHSRKPSQQSLHLRIRPQTSFLQRQAQGFEARARHDAAQATPPARHPPPQP